MKNKAKLILASAVFVAALMLLVPLAQIDMSGGGGIGNSDSDPIVLSDATNSNLTSVSNGDDLKRNLEAGTSVQLSDNISLSLTDSIEIGKSNKIDNIILNLNGKTLTINKIDDSNSNRLVVADGATVTIQNGTIVYNKSAGSAEGKSPIRVGSLAKDNLNGIQFSTLNVNNVNIISGEYGIAVFAKANLNVENSTIIAKSSAIATNGSTPSVASGSSYDSSITIGSGNYVSTQSSAIFFPGGKTLDINGGTFTGKTGFDIRSGTVTIDNATINVTGNPSETKLNKDGSAEMSGPTPWGMGIAVFDRKDYGMTLNSDKSGAEYAPISITIGTTTKINNACYNLYAGDYTIGVAADDDCGKFTGASEHSFTPLHKITILGLNVNWEVNASESTNSKIISGNRITNSTTGEFDEVPLDIMDNRIFANGNAITISDGTIKDTSKITYGNDIIFVDNFDLSIFTIFGGSKDNTSVNSSSITMNGGTVAYIYGGGYGTSADKSASVVTASIEITGGNILATVFGGGLGYATVNETTITISDAAIGRDVVAGGSNNNVTTPVNKVLKATVNISDGTMGNPTIRGGVYGGGQSLAYVETSEINVTGGTIRLLCASGSNGITDTTKMNIDGNAKIIYLLSVNRGVINNSEINIKSSFTGTIDKLALGALSDWDNNGKNNNQFTGGSTDGAVTNSVTLTVECSKLNSSTPDADTQVFLGRGLYSNYGNSAFTHGGNTYYQHYAYSSGTLTGGESITPIAANVTVNGNVNVIAYVGNTTNLYDPTTFIIGTDKTWTFENGAIISFNTGVTTTELQNDGKLIFDGANVGENGLVLTCGGDIEVKNTDFTIKGLYISGADNVTITRCTFTNIAESVVVGDSTQINAIYLNNCTGNVTIGGTNADDKNTIENVSSSLDISSQYGRGIFISSGGGSGKSLIIQNNSISGIAYNALQLSNIGFTTITISNNEIENWDSDNDGIADTPSSSSDFSKGRAIRLNVVGDNAITLTISNNKFTKTYDATILYDNYNIIKVTENEKLTTTLSGNEANLTYESKKKVSTGLVIDALDKSYVTFPNSPKSGILINIVINEVNFTKNGLFISGANNVTITNCKFTDISSGFETTDLIEIATNMYHPTAIHVQNSSGNVLIKDNTINGVGGEEVNKKFMGISITNLKDNTNTSSIEIKDNDIFNIDHNAVYIFGKYSAISITDGNKISEWDKNNDSVNTVQDKNFAGGRAVRIDATSDSINISNNIFVKSYLKTLDQDAVIFGSDLGGSTNNIGYDDGNILKISNSTTISFADNILNLTGIEMNNYLGKNLFNFADANTCYIILFNANDGSFGGEGNILCSITTGSISEPTSPSRSSYSFNGWYSDSNLTTPFTDFTTPISEDTTLYAKWTYTGGSGIPVTPPTDDPEPEPIVPDENNNVTVPSIDDKKADELVHKAVSSGSDSISIIDTNNVEGEYTEVTVSKSDLETISKKIENNNNINSVSIETSEGDIIIEKEVLNSILETTDADSISFEIEDAKDKLTEEQKEAVGDRPVYDINIKAGNENITSFNGKTITISLPYTLKAGEDPENIVVYYVKEDGSLEKVNCTYKDGKVIFETDHLSKYVIGYEESDKPVTPDTPDDKKDDNNTIYYAVAAIVVILIIIALAYYFMKKKQ